MQWYAVTSNNTTSADLSLANTPLEIFKSMGCTFARSTFPLPFNDPALVDSKTYLWEAIFDCFAKKNSDSIAFASLGVFNCPDHLNIELSKVTGAETPEYKADPDNLYCLRALMAARKFKRTAVNADPLQRLHGQYEHAVQWLQADYFVPTLPGRYRLHRSSPFRQDPPGLGLHQVADGQLL